MRMTTMSAKLMTLGAAAVLALSLSAPVLAHREQCPKDNPKPACCPTKASPMPPCCQKSCPAPRR